MTQLHRERSGGWKARKAIPATISTEYARLYGPKFEVKFSRPPTCPEHAAKADFSGWLADVKSQFQRLKDCASGRGSDLNRPDR